MAAELGHDELLQAVLAHVVGEGGDGGDGGAGGGAGGRSLQRLVRHLVIAVFKKENSVTKYINPLFHHHPPP